jgi:hypothetical protein
MTLAIPSAYSSRSASVEPSGIGRGLARIVASAAALATIPLGTELDARAQIGALAAIVVLALVAEGEPLGSDPVLSQQS